MGAADHDLMIFGAKIYNSSLAGQIPSLDRSGRSF